MEGRIFLVHRVRGEGKRSLNPFQYLSVGSLALVVLCYIAVSIDLILLNLLLFFFGLL